MRPKDYPLVTIGIPTYNRADRYLREALASALSQTYPNLEIIVSDNCSSDGTQTLVKSLPDPRIRYFRQPNNIPANDNFNFCLSEAKGEYFQLLHDDDAIDPDFVEACVRAASRRRSVGIIRTGARIIDAQGRVLTAKENDDGPLSTKDFFLAWLHSKSLLFLCSTLFNTERLRSIGGFNSRHQLFQDVLAELKLAAKFGRVDVRDVKASFRQHSFQRTLLSTIREWCEDSLYLLDNMCELLPEHREMLRHEGLRKFAKHNYRIAMKARSPVTRYKAYLVIYQKFNYRYFPPLLGRLRRKLAALASASRVKTG